MTTASRPTLAQIEQALDQGRLFCLMSGRHDLHTATRYWRCRRNGKTRLWKTRPDNFLIPVKAGFRATGAITQEHLFDGSDFKIEGED